MKTEHDFFSDYIEFCIPDDYDDYVCEINRIYTLIYDYLTPSNNDYLFDGFDADFNRSGKCNNVRRLIARLKITLREKIIDRLKATLHADDRFTQQEERDKSWEFEQEYKDKELDLDDIGGDIEEYTTRIVNQCYRPPQKYDEE